MPRIYQRKCDYCDKNYKGYGKKFCSLNCAKKGQKRLGPPLGHIPWNKDKKGLQKHTEKWKREKRKSSKEWWDNHPEEKEKVKKRFEGKKQTEKSRRKRSKALKGNKCYNWKNGISSKNERIRMGVDIKLWREKVFKRDNYKCWICEATNLNAHHLKSFAQYPKLRFKVSNGLTLCEFCHKVYTPYTKGD